MILIIDTSDNEKIKLSLFDKGREVSVCKIKAKRRQSEKLLSTIDKLLKKNNLSSKKITEIKVADQGDSFTALRIGVLTANTLAYAWQIPVSPLSSSANSRLKNFNSYRLVIPQYNRPPNIG